MTNVDFYTGSKDKYRTACQLSNKAIQNGLRVFLHSPDEIATNRLDKLLWNFPPTAFIPHCLSHEAEAATMPVVIGHDDTFPHFELLISLHNECVNFFSRFERVIEIVSEDIEDAKLGRERYGFYRDRGYNLRHFDLRNKG